MTNRASSACTRSTGGPDFADTYVRTTAAYAHTRMHLLACKHRRALKCMHVWKEGEYGKGELLASSCRGGLQAAWKEAHAHMHAHAAQSSQDSHEQSGPTQAVRAHTRSQDPHEQSIVGTLEHAISCRSACPCSTWWEPTAGAWRHMGACLHTTVQQARTHLLASMPMQRTVGTDKTSRASSCTPKRSASDIKRSLGRKMAGVVSVSAGRRRSSWRHRWWACMHH